MDPYDIFLALFINLRCTYVLALGPGAISRVAHLTRMKLNIITHNIHGLNDPETICKARRFINSLISEIDIAMLQGHKLKGRFLANLGRRIMIRCASWILEAAPGE